MLKEASQLLFAFDRSRGRGGRSDDAVRAGLSVAGADRRRCSRRTLCCSRSRRGRMRGVSVPAGTHVIVWRYRVPGLRLGAILSGLAAPTLLLGDGLAIRRRMPAAVPARVTVANST